MQLESVFCDYLKYISNFIKPTTILNIKTKFKKHIIGKLPNDVLKIDKIDIINWCNYIKSLNYSNSFNKGIISILNGFYKYLNKMYNIKNLVEECNIRVENYNKIKNQEITIYDLKQIKKFLGVINDPIYHCFFRFLYFSGLRKGEALALHFYDIQDDKISINKTLTKEYFNGKRLELVPKTKKSIREIRIDKRLLREILNLKKYYNTHFKDFNDNFYVFGGIKPLATTTIDRKNEEYSKKANLYKIRIHDFRHSHATLLYNDNYNVKYIQSRLGHTNVETTLNTYIHLSNEYEKKVVRTLFFQDLL